MEIKLSKNMREQFALFIQQHPPLPLSISLRNMLLAYIRDHAETGLPVDIENFLWSMEDLFRLLDAAAQEQQRQAGGCHSQPTFVSVYEKR
jgi:hypothetical protein